MFFGGALGSDPHVPDPFGITGLTNTRPLSPLRGGVLASGYISPGGLDNEDDLLSPFQRLSPRHMGGEPDLTSAAELYEASQLAKYQLREEERARKQEARKIKEEAKKREKARREEEKEAARKVSSPPSRSKEQKEAPRPVVGDLASSSSRYAFLQEGIYRPPTFSFCSYDPF